MVYFPERQTDGSWTAKPVFTKRIPRTAAFAIDGSEFELYQKITRFVKRQSTRAAAQGDDPRARAVGFLMSLYQRRLASSTYAMRRSLENQAKRLEEGLNHARELVRTAPPDLPDWDELDEFEDAERERLERMLEAITLAGNAEQVREEITELRQLAGEAKSVEGPGSEAKLGRLREIMREEGFFDRPDQRLLLFTEFKDTLDYLMDRLKAWGFSVGCIHGGMKSGSRDEPGSRLYTEQQFREGAIQVLVATEAAGEGINLQCCHILFNYDIPFRQGGLLPFPGARGTGAPGLLPGADRGRTRSGHPRTPFHRGTRQQLRSPEAGAGCPGRPESSPCTGRPTGRVHSSRGDFLAKRERPYAIYRRGAF